MYNEELTPMLLKLYLKIEEKETLLNSFWGQYYLDIKDRQRHYEKRIEDQYPLWIEMQKSSTKY